MINSAQVHALAAMAAKLKAEQQSSLDSNNMEFTFDLAKTITPHNIQRSSSHESHLRNKIHPSLVNSGNMVANIAATIATPKSSKMTSSINSCENIYRPDGSGEYMYRGPSGKFLNSSFIPSFKFALSYFLLVICRGKYFKLILVFIISCLNLSTAFKIIWVFLNLYQC